jgi:hypothetical protein
VRGLENEDPARFPQVTAQSHYEAVAQALRVFREDDWSEDSNRGPASLVR